MFRALLVPLVLFYSLILNGQTEIDTVREVPITNIGINVLDRIPYNLVIEEGLKLFSSEGVKAGLCQMAQDLTVYYEDTKWDRVLYYPELEFYSLVQLLDAGSLERKEEELLLGFFMGYFSGRIIDPISYEEIEKSEKDEPFYLRLQLYCSFLRREAESMFKYLDAYYDLDSLSLATISLKGDVDLAREKYESAIGWYSKSIGMSPEYAYGYMMRALCFNVTDILGDAENDLRESLRLFPTNAMAMSELGVVCMKDERYSEAISLYKQSLAMDSSYVWLYHNMGYAYGKQDQADSAIYYLEMAVPLNPGIPDIFMDMGNVYQKMGEYEVARYIYSKAIDIDPGFAPALVSQADVLYRLRRMDEALVLFERALELDSSDAYVYQRIGDVYYEQEMYEEGIVFYEEGRMLDSSIFFLSYMLGDSYLALEEYEKAVVYYERALVVDSVNSGSWTNMGWAWYMLGDFKSSLYCSLKASALDPYITDPYSIIPKYNAALALLRLGRVEESFAMYRDTYGMGSDYDNTGAVTDLDDLIEKKIMVKEAKHILKNILNEQ